MRVTTAGHTARMTADLARAQGRVADLQDRLGSGKQIQRWADDPAAAVGAARARSGEVDQAAYARSRSDATGWLEAADSALQQLSTLTAQAQALAVQAANDSLGPAGREAVAAQLEAVRDGVAQQATATWQGRSLLGGFTSGSPLAQDATTGWTWSGDGAVQRRQVDEGQVLAVSLDGAGVLGFDGAAGTDLLSTLDALAAAVRADDPAGRGAAAAQLGERADGVRQSLGLVGASQQRLEAAGASGADATERWTRLRSEAEDVDVVRAVVELQAARTAYETALSVAGRADMPSLADYLR